MSEAIFLQTFSVPILPPVLLDRHPRPSSLALMHLNHAGLRMGPFAFGGVTRISPHPRSRQGKEPIHSAIRNPQSGIPFAS